MITIVTGDWHLTRNVRDAYRFGVFKQMKRLLKKYESSHIILLGDITEEKDRHSGELVNRIVDELAELQNHCALWILRGNHDGTNVETPFFRFTEHLKNITWINSPEAVGRWLFLPHTRNYKRDWKNVDLKRHEWIFAHNTFEGALSEAGSVLKGIQTSVFPEGARVISGDVHTPQKIDCVTYVGSPHTVDFGDEFQPRALLIDGRQCKSVELHGPRKILVKVKAGFYNRSEDIQKGDILKIEVKLRAEDYANWPELQRHYRQWGEEFGASVAAVLPIKASNTLRLSSKRDPRALAPSDKATMKTYGKRRKLSPDYMDTGYNLMEK